MTNKKSTPTKKPETQKPSNPSTQKRKNPPTQKPSNSSTDKWEFYLDKSEKWRWKRTAPNGEIVGASTQGYVFKVDCVKNAERNGWSGKK